jgi:LuxR family transcriptional regulator, maltose regulon positive regulatory protein
MTTPLLATKLFIPPVSDESVRRLDLIARLDEGLRQGRCLTLITAPPGFGKTTLTAHWIASNARRDGYKFCWLSLEESDNDPGQFWTYLLAALQTAQAGLGEALAQSIWNQPGPAVIKAFLIGLVNEISEAEHHLILVLDDLHLIQNEAIFEGLAFLIEHHPPQLHLTLLSRTLPPLSLARLRSRNQVTELQQGDLRFTPAETFVFLSAKIPGISEDEVQLFHQRLEGWPSGLQLTASAIGANPFDEDVLPPEEIVDTLTKMRSRVMAQLSRAQPYLLDYLTDEVLSRQPESIQSFLLRASMLERICAPLCDASFGKKPDSEGNHQRLLVQIEKQNLFLVPLDPERKWFRFQRLFGELLQARLISQTTPLELQELHQKAAAWYQAQGFLVEAMQHALKGNRIETALDLAVRIAPDYLHNGRINALLGLLSAFPDEALISRPILRLYQARALMFHGHYNTAWDILELIESRMGPEMDRPLLAELAALKALLATFTRSPDETIHFAKSALAALPGGDLISAVRLHLILGAMHRLEARLPQAADEILAAQRLAAQTNQPFLENTALENLAAVRIEAGDLPGAARLLTKAAQAGIGTGFGQVCLAAIEYEWNHLDTAEAFLAEGLRLGEKSGVIDVMVNGYLCLSLLRWTQGNPQAAVEAFNLANELSITSPGSLWEPLIATQRRRLMINLSQASDPALLLDEPDGFSPHNQPQPRYLQLSDQVVSVREFMAARNWQGAINLANSIEATCVEAGLIGLLVEVSLLKALAYQAVGDHASALSTLNKAVQMAAPNRFLRVFLNEGGAAQRLLAEASAQTGAGEAGTIHELLSHFPPAAFAQASDEDQKPSETTLQPSDKNLLPADIEPLTAREQEVLELIAAGHTNREIADLLVMTENTVKKHTSHIFGKLIVSNRTQALNTARKLGLIPSK